LTAVSETSNNVVVHAYGGTPGPLSVSVATGPDGLDVVIQDRGEGIQQVIASADRTGLGLGVITALADRAEFASRPGGGTDVRMSFLSRGSTSSKGDWTTHDGACVEALAAAQLLERVEAEMSQRCTVSEHELPVEIADRDRFGQNLEQLDEHRRVAAREPVADGDAPGQLNHPGAPRP
jgi:Histidine kinase-like ATPase domain